MTRHDPVVRLRHMLDYARDAVDMAASRSQAQLELDRMLAMGLIGCVIVIGEAAGRIDAGIRARHPEIPWRDVKGMRNRLVHGYEIIDFKLLWDTVTTDLPLLIEQLERIIAEEEAAGDAS